ncbi:MAG: SAM-dependent methyltransferase, partial [Clostridia bacterium]|nr:SAM-dependent methyltransferase [Clostridia bacterium]
MERMHNTLGTEYDDFIRSYEEPPKRGLRVNILKTDHGEFAAICPWRLEKTGILPEGFTVLGAENVGRHPYHVAGLFYMQEPSAMSAVAACPADESGLKLL